MAISRVKLREEQNKPKPSVGRYIWLGIVVAIVAVGLYFLAGRGASSDKASRKATTPINDSLARLYSEAEEDMNTKDYSSAAEKFKQLVNIAPRYKDANTKAKDAADKLYNEAVNDIAAGNYEQAIDKLETVKSIDPTNPKVDKKIEEAQDKTGSSTPPPTDNGSGNNDPGANNPPTAGSVKPIPSDATPLSILVKDIDGYRSIQNGWIQQPVEAGTTYIPTADGVGNEIDRVLLTVNKFDTKQEADDKLKSEKDTFPLEGEDIDINNHGAYTGLYSFQGSGQFFELRQLATVTWTRDNWFFSIQVLPKEIPASAYKKGIGRDVALKFGY